MDATPVHIIGRGIAGLSAAFALARSGRRVVLLGPRMRPGSATFAAVGVCSVKGNISASSPLFADKIAAQRQLRSWLASVEGVAQRAIPQHFGTVEPYTTRAAYAHVRERVFHRKFTGCTRSFAIDLSDLPTYLQTAWPLYPQVKGAFVYPADAWYDPVAATEALEIAVARLGGTFLDAAVERLDESTTGELVAVTAARNVVAKSLVLAAGAFSDAILAASGIAHPKQSFVEGESIFGGRVGPGPDTIVNFGKLNLVAHETTLAYGSTSRNHKQLKDCAPNDAAADQLRSDALAITGAGDFSTVRWGIRGRYQSQAPVLIPVSLPSGRNQAILLTGFHKSGLQLAPLMALRLVDKL